MASVRASVVNQARMAAFGLASPSGDLDAPPDCPAIDQLVRCARLSENADQTLEWAMQTLRAHSTSRVDQLAFQLLRAARARLDAQRTTSSVSGNDHRRSDIGTFAWA